MVVPAESEAGTAFVAVVAGSFTRAGAVPVVAEVDADFA